MTSLLTNPTSASDEPPGDDRPQGRGRLRVPRRPGRPRSVVGIGLLGALTAAAWPLLIWMTLGVAGWFLADAGAHGQPRDGLRVGALAWLMGHGATLTVEGVRLSMIPLGITLVTAWALWRAGARVGESVSGLGPDADAVGDGQRDLTVPVAIASFATTYAVLALVVHALAGPAAGGTLRLLGGVMALVLGVAGPAIAIGSGRAAIWLAGVPDWLRGAVGQAAATLVAFGSLSAVLLAVALAKDLGSAANVLARLHADAPDSALFTAGTVLIVPNATIFAGAFALGPGFSIGSATLVSPALVVLGPVPALPLLAALPEGGQPSGWVAALPFVPAVIALATAWRLRHRFPTGSYLDALLQGLVGGVVAGLAFGLLAHLSGGAAGPGRLAEVGPFVLEVTVRAVAGFALGGAAGSVLAAWWVGRGDPSALADVETAKSR